MDKDITKALLRGEHIVGYVLRSEVSSEFSSAPPEIKLTIQVDHLSQDFFEDLFSKGTSKVAIFKLR